MWLIKNKSKILFRKSKKIIIIALIVFLVVSAGSYYIFHVLTPNERYGLVNNPLGHRLLSNWHAVRKIVNLVHFPYWFKESKLEIYRLTISPDNMRELDSRLPLKDNRAGYTYMTDADKHYVSAEFTAVDKNYAAKVKIRYRGTNWNNWDAEKKAIRIKFPKNNYFRGQEALNLLIPYDRAYFAEVLSSYRAEKLGVMAAHFRFVRLEINGRDYGVYLAAEPWSNAYLARSGIMDTDNIFSCQDLYEGATTSLFSTARLADWKSFTAKEEIGDFPELAALVDLIENANDEEFAKMVGQLVDLDKVYRWELINLLASSAHQNDGGNIVLLFKKETGKFEPMAWDVNMNKVNPKIFAGSGILFRRIFSQPQFWHNFLQVVGDYVSNGNNLADDLAHYDNLYKELKVDFYKDQAKIDNDFFFTSQVEKYRQYIVDNFNFAKTVLALNDFPGKAAAPEGISISQIVFPGTFSYFKDIFTPIDEFAAEHKDFMVSNGNTLILKKGIHEFHGVTIVPVGLRLVVEAGAVLKFAHDASLISYSNVAMNGTEKDPVALESLENDPWGVFGVINTGEEANKFDYIRVSGGSAAVINGVEFTSQFSLHNVNSEIAHSEFTGSNSDDGLHAVLGSVVMRDSEVADNASDGLDVDFVRDSTVENCNFYNDQKEGSNGDGIDLSFTRNMVIKNNKISNFGDKCVSVGENAWVDISGNVLENCNIGIAVKDNSIVIIKDNFISGNDQDGLALYRKKQDFIEGGHAIVAQTTLWDNANEIRLDDYSDIKISSSTVEGGYGPGTDIITTKPDPGKINAVNGD